MNQNEPQAQRATAFHFLISKRLGFLVEEEAADADEGAAAAALNSSPVGTISTSVSIAAAESRNRSPNSRVHDLTIFFAKWN